MRVLLSDRSVLLSPSIPHIVLLREIDFLISSVRAHTHARAHARAHMHTTDLGLCLLSNGFPESAAAAGSTERILVWY